MAGLRAGHPRFYAGLTSIMSALVFFQLSAIIIILGAELNRGLMEIRHAALAASLHGRSPK